MTKSTGIHFNQKGHSVSDMQISILEKVFNQDPQFRKQRERIYIQKFNTRYKELINPICHGPLGRDRFMPGFVKPL